MPNIDLVPVQLYQPGDPYNHQVDNLPLLGLMDQIALVNFQVDIDANTLRSSIGSVGSLAARLATSLNDDGSLKSQAIDAALHNIAEHMDGSIIISGVTYNYVRMTGDERAKLSLVASEANNLTVKFDLDNIIPSDIPSVISTISTSEVVFTDGQIHFVKSDSIGWRINDDGSIEAETTFPIQARHQHFYDFTPIPENPISPDYIHYLVTSVGTPYQEGSLRVTINGVRLTKTDPVYYPTLFGPHGPSWVLITFAEGEATNGIVTGGDFSLSNSINVNDVIIVDWDILLTGS